MGKAWVTPNAAREVRVERGESQRTLQCTAAMLAGRWETEGGNSNCSTGLRRGAERAGSLLRCLCAGLSWGSLCKSAAQAWGKGPTRGSEIGQPESQRGGKPVCVGRGSPVGLL